MPSVPVPQRSLAWGPSQVPRESNHLDFNDVHQDHGYYLILVRSLIRAQLGLSMLCLAFALTVTASFPILCAVLPGLDHVVILGLPLTLIALGMGIYPVILAIGWFYSRQANRLEKRFIRIIDHVDEDSAGV